MDYVDPATNIPLPIDWQPEHFYVPSARSTVTQLVDAAEQTLNKVQRLDLEATVESLNRLLASLNRTVDAFDAAGLSERTKSALHQMEAIPFAEIGQEARSLVSELRDTNRALQQTVANPAWTSVGRDLQATAAQVRKLAENPALPAMLERADQVMRRIDRKHILRRAHRQRHECLQCRQPVPANPQSADAGAARAPGRVGCRP